VIMPDGQEHRAAAEQALDAAQRNPVLSAEQLMRVAQIHALLAIEARLRDLLGDRTDQAWIRPA
jgi:hypothetical protein